jgi:hypothetical protein
LSAAAAAIQKAHERPAANKILEFAYSREIARHNLDATNFLGLAEIRLDSGDVHGAVDLLNRLVLVVGQPCENLDAAAALLESSHHSAEAAVFLAQLVHATPWEPQYRLRFARAQIAANDDAAQARKDLAAIAGADDVPYAVRADAAAALAGKSPGANLGSEELNLLASAAPITPKQANQPYFTRARVRAAAALHDDHDRIALLRAAIEDSPSSDAGRIALFHAAAAAHEDQLAYSDARPLLDSLALPGNSSPEDQGADESPSSDEAASPARMSRVERLRIVIELATVSENLDRLGEGVRFLRAAQKFQTDPARRAELRQHLARLRAEIDRRAKNAARQPEIHGQLEQDRLVRPRLIAARENPQSRTEGSRP